MNKMKFFFLVLIYIFLITGCGVLQEEPTATPTDTPIPSSTPIPTDTPTITPSPTPTYTPTPTFTPTPISPEDLKVKNDLGKQTRVSVDLEIARLLFADKEILFSGHPQVMSDKIPPMNFDVPIFKDKPVVGEIILRVSNQGEKIYTLFPSNLTIQIGGTQIILEDYITAEAYFSKGANPYNPDILPGSTLYLAYWFGVEEDDLSDISKIAVALEAPYEVLSDGSWFDTGQHYFFQIDISEWGFEPMSEEVMDGLY